AEGMRAASGADFALATTGIAGPGGGTPEKPVGLIYAALASAGGVEVETYRLKRDRALNRRTTALNALDMLRRHLLQKQP
ncbi:MAG: CinA family protein, partial [Christensenellaceae bacterium]